MNAQDLKNSILQLAIQGKLVEQREADGTAKELLKKIGAEKKQLTKEGKIKKLKELPEIKEDEIPFDIPESWEWVRLGQLCNYGKCDSIPATKIPKEAWLLDLEDIEKDSGRILSKKRMKDVTSSSSKHIFSTGNVLYSKLRPYLNKVIIADEDGYATSEILPLDFGMNIYNRYAQTVLMSPYFINYTVKCSYGVKMPRLGTSDGQIAVFPLPPLEEQQRIVAKIEELLPYVVKYNVAYSEVEGLNKKFPEDMQKSILQYAIQGKLVEQREEDGTGEDLYMLIQEEKKKLIKEGKIKKIKELPEITEDEIPFDIPDNWKWVRLGDLCDYGKCNSSPAKNIPKDTWILDLEDVEKDSGRILNKKSMQDLKSTSSKHIFKKGDVLYSKLRPYLNKVVVADDDGYCTSEILPLDFGTHVYNRYAQTVLMSPYFINYTVKCSYGVKMPRLGTRDGQLALFPLAPLGEQQRIVEKIFELLPYAKQLAIRIEQSSLGVV